MVHSKYSLPADDGVHTEDGVRTESALPGGRAAGDAMLGFGGAPFTRLQPEISPGTWNPTLSPFVLLCLNSFMTQP